MFRKFNIKTLSGTLILLIVITTVVIITDKKSSKLNRSKSFESNLVDADTAEITSVYIKTKHSDTGFELVKNAEWQLKSDGKTYNADISMVENVLTTLQKAKPKRLAAKDKSKWEKYEVTDSLASRVKVFKGEKKIVDLYIGKFNYTQPKNPSPYGRQQGTMTSFVRKNGQKEVYAVDGMMAMAFNRRLDDFRDKRLVDFSKDDIHKITYLYPDRSELITMKDGSWFVNGTLADSSAMENYLSGLSNLKAFSFNNNPMLTENKAEVKVELEDNEGQTITLSAFEVADTNIGTVIESSINEGAYFNGNSSDLFNKIYVPTDSLIAKDQ